MFEFIHYGQTKLLLFVLLLVRASGLLLAAPMLGHRSFPMTAKIGLAVFLAIMLIPAVSEADLPEVSSLIELVGIVLRELMVGILIGFFFALVIKAAEAAGSLIGYQVGLIIASMFDPNANDQVAIIGRLWVILASLIFLAINGHHLVLGAFSDSCRLIPPGHMAVNSGTPELMIKYTAYVFVLALKIAAPIMVTLFLTDIALGTVAKMMPNMNIFIIGFPIKIGVGLLVMGLSLPIFSYLLQTATNYLNQATGGLLISMGKV